MNLRVCKADILITTTAGPSISLSEGQEINLDTAIYTDAKGKAFTIADAIRGQEDAWFGPLVAEDGAPLVVVSFPEHANEEPSDEQSTAGPQTDHNTGEVS
jgi:hypothetical protein